jgi:hypothetical protein
MAVGFSHQWLRTGSLALQALEIGVTRDQPDTLVCELNTYSFKLE